MWLFFFHSLSYHEIGKLVEPRCRGSLCRHYSCFHGSSSTSVHSAAEPLVAEVTCKQLHSWSTTRSQWGDHLRHSQYVWHSKQTNKQTNKNQLSVKAIMQQKKICGMKTCVQIWKSVFPCPRFAVVPQQATDSTGTHTKGKAHRYHSKATMKALNSNVHVHQSKIKCEFY